MNKLGLIVCLAAAFLAFSSDDMWAAQKKKKTTQPPAKETPYQYCKRMIAKHYGAAARPHHVVVSPSGKITCWYYS